MHLFNSHSEPAQSSDRSLTPYVVLTVLLFIFTLLSFPAKSLVLMSGELDRHLKAYNYGQKADNRWVMPTHSNQHVFEQMFSAFAQQNWPLAKEYAEQLNYKVIQFDDVDTKQRYYLLQEKYASGHANFVGGGVYVYNPQGLNAVLQAPHPKRDLFTGTQAVDAFLYTQSKFLMLAGTRRDSSHDISECTGTNYSASDVAHQTNSYYQVAHQYLSDFDDATVFIQYHGFGTKTLNKLQSQCGTSNDLMLNLSEGVKYANNDNPNSIMQLLKQSVVKEGTIKACTYGEDTKSLGGTWNVQGRHVNGSHNSCHTSASASSQRFIHLEQSYKVRKYHRTNMAKHLKTALEAYFE